MSDPKTPDEFDADALLSAAFAEAQAARPVDLPDDLTTRILADAAAVQAAPTPRRLGLAGWLAEVRDGLGGWGALAGLGVATLAGVWIGVGDVSGSSLTNPAPTEAAAMEIWDEGADDLELLFPSYDSLLGET